MISEFVVDVGAKSVVRVAPALALAGGSADEVANSEGSESFDESELVEVNAGSAGGMEAAGDGVDSLGGAC